MACHQVFDLVLHLFGQVVIGLRRIQELRFAAGAFWRKSHSAEHGQMGAAWVEGPICMPQRITKSRGGPLRVDRRHYLPLVVQVTDVEDLLLRDPHLPPSALVWPDRVEFSKPSAKCNQVVVRLGAKLADADHAIFSDDLFQFFQSIIRNRLTEVDALYFGGKSWSNLSSFDINGVRHLDLRTTEY